MNEFAWNASLNIINFIITSDNLLLESLFSFSTSSFSVGNSTLSCTFVCLSWWLSLRSLSRWWWWSLRCSLNQTRSRINVITVFVVLFWDKALWNTKIVDCKACHLSGDVSLEFFNAFLKVMANSSRHSSICFSETLVE